MNVKRIPLIQERMSLTFFYVSLVIFIVCPAGGQGARAASLLPQQAITVSGTVTSAEGNETLPGVSVLIKGTTIGTTTNADGHFQLQVSSRDVILVLSYVGFITQEIPVGDRTTLRVALQSELTQLDEVVVVGYGTQRKADVTGSLSTLKKEDFNEGAIMSVDQLIAGKAPGIQVVQNNGEPGGGFSINIRGVGSITGGTAPLYVVDGLPIDNSVLIEGNGKEIAQARSFRNPLSFLNPNDIESIDILKDASATAIYGSRGANGVILITTKKGTSGELKVDYNGTYGVQNVHRKLNLLNAQQYREGMNAIIDAGEGDPLERVDEIQGDGTDWQDVIFQDNAITQTHNLSFSGGSGNGSYLVALNHASQEGLVKGTAYKRYGARFSLNHHTERLNMGLTGNLSYINDTFAPNGFDIGIRKGVINSAKSYDPTLEVYDASGNYVSDNGDDNPLVIINGSDMNGNRYQYLANFFTEYFVLPNLAVKLNTGVDVKNDDKRIYKDRTTRIGTDLGGLASAYDASQNNYLIEGTVSFKEEVREGHFIDAVVGVTTQHFMRENLEIHGRGFPTDATNAFNFALADRASIETASYKAANQLLSYLGRVNYRFNDRYMLTASYRIDGSSRFGEDNRFGYFPSVSMGWLIDQENFFSEAKDVVSFLKLRASWGKTGNQEIGNYSSLTTFAPINPDIYVGSRQSYVLDDMLVNTLNPLRLPNPDLKWETTTQYNVGLDFGLLEDRFSGTIEWYRKNTDDMLVNLPVPSESGYRSRLTNVGSMMNEGFEFSLSSNNIRLQHFSWSTDLNFSTLRNEVLDIGNITNIISGSMTSEHSDFSLITPGLPARSFYGYEVVGIWQEDDDFSAVSNIVSPGHFKFRDVNADGVIDAEDRVNLGNSFPDLMWAFGNSITYKAFNFHFFFQGVEGVKMLNGNLLESYWPRSGRTRANRFAEPFLNRWTPDNPTDEQPSFVGLTGQSDQAINSRTVVDASYVKLQTVKLSYTLPRSILKNTLRAAEVYIVGQNLLTFSDYEGFDPALNPGGSANFRVDWNTYPSATTWLLGVNLGL